MKIVIHQTHPEYLCCPLYFLDQLRHLLLIDADNVHPYRYRNYLDIYPGNVDLNGPYKYGDKYHLMACLICVSTRLY